MVQQKNTEENGNRSQQTARHQSEQSSRHLQIQIPQQSREHFSYQIPGTHFLQLLSRYLQAAGIGPQPKQSFMQQVIKHLDGSFPRVLAPFFFCPRCLFSAALLSDIFRPSLRDNGFRMKHKGFVASRPPVLP